MKTTSIQSDLKNRDLFRDPLWLLRNFLDKYKLMEVPTNWGWTLSIAGSGGCSQFPTEIYVYTGTTALSRGLCFNGVRTLNSGDYSRTVVDYSKRLELLFQMVRVNSDAEAVARIQLKAVQTEGALAAQGLGIEIANYTVYGEAYGTARQTVSLGTIPDDRLWQVKIVLVPGTRVEFWIGDMLVGVLTGTAVPIGTNTSNLVISIINGATGGVNAILTVVGGIKIVQEW